MNEKDLRKWHRRMGITLAILIIIQAGTGILLTLGSLTADHNDTHSEQPAQQNASQSHESEWEEAMEFIHHGAGGVGFVYRLIVGFGVLGMAVSGSYIFFKIRSRSSGVKR
jgi:hypothetical protein